MSESMLGWYLFYGYFGLDVLGRLLLWRVRKRRDRLQARLDRLRLRGGTDETG